MRRRLIGLPGTGKTTRLLQYLDEILSQYSARDIIYCSYSNAAVDEAKERVMEKFTIAEHDLMYFRTMHSLCLLILRQAKIKIGKKAAKPSDFRLFLENYQENNPDLEEFLEDMEILAGTSRFLTPEEKDDPLSFYTLGTHPETFFLHIFSYMYASFGSTPSQPKTFGPHIQSLRKRVQLSRSQMRKLISYLYLMEHAWKEFKQERDLFEFDELLVKTLQYQLVPRAKILIVDEYQDSSRIQSQLINFWADSLEETIVAGDPNQAIYGFNGASPEYLEHFKADSSELLHQSWRVPAKVISYAQQILGNHWTEQMTTGSTSEGRVFHANWEEIPWSSYHSVFILGRTRSILKEAQKVLSELGVINHLETSPLVRQFYQLYWNFLNQTPIEINLLLTIKQSAKLFFSAQTATLLERIEEKETEAKKIPHYRPKQAERKLLEKILGVSHPTQLFRKVVQFLPRAQEIVFRQLVSSNKPPLISTQDQHISLMTMHASKGKEAELVILRNVASWYEKEGRTNDDEEERIYFVAATRTKRDLIIVDFEKESFEPTKFLPAIEEMAMTEF